MVAHPIDGGEGPHRRRALSQLSRGVTRCSRASGAPLPEGVGGQRLLTRRLWSEARRRPTRCRISPRWDRTPLQLWQDWERVTSLPEGPRPFSGPAARAAHPL